MSTRIGKVWVNRFGQLVIQSEMHQRTFTSYSLASRYLVDLISGQGCVTGWDGDESRFNRLDLDHPAMNRAGSECVPIFDSDTAESVATKISATSVSGAIEFGSWIRRTWAEREAKT